MGDGSFFKGEKRKQKKEILEKKAVHMPKPNYVSQVEIINRKKGK